MPTHTLFPTRLYQAAVLASRSPLLKELEREALMLEERDREGRRWSAENYPRGYTSYGSMDQLHLFSDSFRELRERLDPHARAFVKSLGLRINPRELRMTRLWVNVMRAGCAHALHIHPLSVVSGSFYVRLPGAGKKGADALSAAIRFEDPRLSRFMARPLARAPRGQDSAYLHSLLPRPGEAVLFESWLAHEVPPQSDPGPRISVSFNYDWTPA